MQVPNLRLWPIFCTACLCGDDTITFVLSVLSDHPILLAALSIFIKTFKNIKGFAIMSKSSAYVRICTELKNVVPSMITPVENTLNPLKLWELSSAVDADQLHLILDITPIRDKSLIPINATDCRCYCGSEQFRHNFSEWAN